MKDPLLDLRLEKLSLMATALAYFNTHPGRTVHEAAVDLGVDYTVLNKVIGRLCACGWQQLFPEDSVAIDEDHPGGPVIVSEDQGFSRSMQLTPFEAWAVVLGLEEIAQVDGAVDATALHGALTKTRAALDHYIRTDGGEGVSLPTAPAEDTAGETVRGFSAALRKAAEASNIVEFDYTGTKDRVKKHRRTIATTVFSLNNHTYLVAFDPEKDAHRTFRIDRMSALRITEETASNYARERNLNLSDPFGLLDPDVLRVSVVLAPDALWLVNEHPLDLGQENEDGTWSAILRAKTPEWAVRFAIEQGGAISVVAPQSIVEAVKDRLESAISAYSK